MPYPRPKRIDSLSKARRFDVIYIALTSVRAREIIDVIGKREYLPQAGEDNAWLLELAEVVDDALQGEVERRRRG